MKYFLPELLYDYSSDDEAVFEQAEKRWDEACKQYRLDFKKMKKPRFVTKLNKMVNHDGEIVNTNLAENYFSMMLEQDKSFNKVNYNEIAYTTVEKPKVFLHKDLDDGSPFGLFWLYDEVFWEGKSGTHSILLTGGMELVIAFKDVRITDLDKMQTPPPVMWNLLK